MANKHWTEALTNTEVAEQLQAVVIFNLDESENLYDDAEVLELVEVFNDRLDEEADKELIATLNVYAVPHWNGDAQCLTRPHLELLLNAVCTWLED